MNMADLLNSMSLSSHEALPTWPSRDLPSSATKSRFTSASALLLAAGTELLMRNQRRSGALSLGGAVCL